MLSKCSFCVNTRLKQLKTYYMWTGVSGRQTCEIHKEGKKIIIFDSVWPLGVERTGELRMAVLTDLCRPLISLTGT